MTDLTAISLFSSGGIGDLAVRAAGFEVLVSNELLADRHAVFAHNFPKATAITGDIRAMVDKVERAARDKLDGGDLTLLYATPPCQGMSKNGRGKLLSAIRAGRKPPLDERNRLIIPTMELARRLRPEIVLLENVPEMEATVIVDDDGRVQRILDFVQEQLGPEYSGGGEVVEFADFGVPQCRQRLISVFTRHPELASWRRDAGSLIPRRTHSKRGKNGTLPWVTLREAVAGLPALDAGTQGGATSDVPFHRVPLLDAMKYWWVRNTPPERCAFDNQCVECRFTENAGHTSGKGKEGINRSSKSTPVYCVRCSALLPRPSVERGGTRHIMRGFTSAYKRMSFDKPASALTRNLSYACSDNKLHPEQHRVLSLREAFRVHTIDEFRYEWKRADGRTLSDKTIREIIGESIPPLGLRRILDHIVNIHLGRLQCSKFEDVGPLFAVQDVGI